MTSFRERDGVVLFIGGRIIFLRMKNKFACLIAIYTIEPAIKKNDKPALCIRKRNVPKPGGNPLRDLSVFLSVLGV